MMVRPTALTRKAPMTWTGLKLVFAAAAHPMLTQIWMARMIVRTSVIIFLTGL